LRYVGVFDNSPIGKIEVRGPDAAGSQPRVHEQCEVPGAQARLWPDAVENGIIIDDGVFVRWMQ
jgi:sarcosine oxidase subunit alpha